MGQKGMKLYFNPDKYIPQVLGILIGLLLVTGYFVMSNSYYSHLKFETKVNVWILIIFMFTAFGIWAFYFHSVRKINHLLFHKRKKRFYEIHGKGARLIGSGNVWNLNAVNSAKSLRFRMRYYLSDLDRDDPEIRRAKDTIKKVETITVLLFFAIFIWLGYLFYKNG